MKVSMFMKEKMHADHAKFCLLVLISKYAWDPWRRSLTSQTTEANGEWGAFSPSIGPQPKCHANVRPWDVQSCRPKGRCFPFTPSQKIAVEGSFILQRFELEIVPSRLPCGHPHRREFFTKGYRSCIAQLSLGWSLVDGRNSLSVLANSTRNISRPTKGPKEIHSDTLAPSAKIKIKKGEKPFSQETLQKKKSTQEANVHTNPQQDWTRNKFRRRRRDRKKTNKKQMDMVNTEKRKEKQEVWTTNKYPCLV